MTRVGGAALAVEHSDPHPGRVSSVQTYLGIDAGGSGSRWALLAADGSLAGLPGRDSDRSDDERVADVVSEGRIIGPSVDHPGDGESNPGDHAGESQGGRRGHRRHWAQ